MWDWVGREPCMGLVSSICARPHCCESCERKNIVCANLASTNIGGKIHYQVSQNFPYVLWRRPVVSPTSRFANIPSANVLCRSTKKRNERCACICFILSAMIQKSGIRMYITRSFSHWSGESSYGTHPTHTTRRRNDRKPLWIIRTMNLTDSVSKQG